MLKGLNTDVAISKHPQENTRFVLNGVYETNDGDHYNISTEAGNALAFTLPGDLRYLGHINTNDNNIVIFSVTDDSSLSEIGVLTGNRPFGSQPYVEYTYTALVSSDCLGFNKEHPIKGLFQIINGCERIIYFYDGINPDRSINLDRLESYLLPGFSIDDPNVDKWNCNLFSLIPNYSPPKIDFVRVNNSGGNLKTGQYIFAVRYLDANFNPTDFMSYTQGVRIIEGSEAASYKSMAGSDTGITTSKSITLEISNIDQQYSYIQIAAIGYTLGNGLSGESFLSQEYSINSNNIIATLANLTSNTIIDSSDIVIDADKYVSSLAMEKVDNRLLRLNLKKNVYNWSEFQRAAINITSHYVSKRRTVSLLSTKESHKSPEHYFYDINYCRDEVYSFGIVWQFKDGSTSPVFHIPGRTADSISQGNINIGNSNDHYRDQVSGTDWDTKLLTVVADGKAGLDLDTEIEENNVRHLNKFVGDAVPRWQVYNTAILTNQGENLKEGILAYYESTNTYPENTDCNDISVYGNLAGTPIRYHRMPDQIIDPSYIMHTNGEPSSINEFPEDNKNAWDLGLKFSNIIPPQQFENDIVGYIIVRQKRTDADKTVVDQGIAQQCPRGQVLDNIYYDYNEKVVTQTLPASVLQDYPGNDKVWYYHSPELNFKKKDLDFTHFVPYKYVYSIYNAVYDDDNTKDVHYRFTNSSSINDYAQVAVALHYSTRIKKLITLDVIDKNYVNAAVNSVVGGYGVFNEGQVDAGFVVSSYNNEPTVGLPGLFSIPDTQDWIDSRHSIYDKANNFLTWSGDLENNGVFRVYGAFKSTTDPYGNLFNQEYIPISSISTNTEIEVYGGDVFTSLFAVKNHLNVLSQRAFLTARDPSDKYFDAKCTFIMYPYVESTINSGLRYATEEVSAISVGGNSTNVAVGLFYPEYYISPEDWFGGFSDISNDNSFEYYSRFNYNNDYSEINYEKVYFSLNIGFNYCSDCQGNFPNDSVWSDKQLLDSSIDAWKSFKPNNKKIFPAGKGQITNAVYYRNTLYVLAERTLFMVKPNPQEIQTDASTVYIGTGDFLSIPEQELMEVDTGAGGAKNRFSLRKTETGIYYVDDIGGKVYNIYDGIKSISDIGMSNWFRNNLRSDHPIDAPNVNTSVLGFYDPRHHRYLIHNSDFNIEKREPGFSREYFWDRMYSVTDLPRFLPIDLFNEVQQTYTGGETIYTYTINTPGKYNLSTNLSITQSDRTIIFYINGVAQQTLINTGLDGGYYTYRTPDYTNPQGFDLVQGDILTVVATEPVVSFITSITLEEFVFGDKTYNYFSYGLGDSSWTLSYDTKGQRWASFHSYMPIAAMNTSDYMLTSPDGQAFYTHGEDAGPPGPGFNTEFCEFYDNVYDFIVEFVANTQTDSILKSVNWLTRSEKFIDNGSINGVPDRFIQKDVGTFTDIIVYNESQSTGNIRLAYAPYAVFYNIPYTWTNNVRDIRRNNSMLSVAGLYNLSKDEFFLLPNLPQQFPRERFSEEFRDRENGYYSNGQGYIDKVPKHLDSNKDLYRLDPIKGTYHVIRLIKSKDVITFHLGNQAQTEDVNFKLTLDFMQTINSNSFKK